MPLTVLLVLLLTPRRRAVAAVPRQGRLAALVLATILLGSWSGDRAWRLPVSGPTVLVDVDAIGTLMTDPAPSAGAVRW